MSGHLNRGVWLPGHQRTLGQWQLLAAVHEDHEHGGGEPPGPDLLQPRVEVSGGGGEAEPLRPQLDLARGRVLRADPHLRLSPLCQNLILMYQFMYTFY